MTDDTNPRPTQRISAEFAARLEGLAEQEKIRAIVLLQTPAPGKAAGRRQDAVQRKAAVEAVRAATEQGLRQIDAILQQSGGRRLSEGVDALGSVPVETTAAGIRMLGASRWAKVVLEDQQIHPSG